MELSLNVNDKVYVELTEYGYKVLNKSEYANVYYSLPSAKYIESTLWQLMAIFGPHSYCGSEQMFKENKIYYRWE